MAVFSTLILNFSEICTQVRPDGRRRAGLCSERHAGAPRERLRDLHHRRPGVDDPAERRPRALHARGELGALGRLRPVPAGPRELRGGDPAHARGFSRSAEPACKDTIE